jgi:ABC-type Zn uptake system ZnuABC Zn-binding protein ZnuA
VLGRALIAACALASSAASAAPALRVVATIEPLCMLARELGGERVACTTLVPPGASPAVPALTAATIRRPEG